MQDRAEAAEKASDSPFFFLPLLVMTGCCIVFGVQPFGDNSLLIIDGLHQYMPFYSVLYDKLKGGETLLQFPFRTGN